MGRGELAGERLVSFEQDFEEGLIKAVIVARQPLLYEFGLASWLRRHTNWVTATAADLHRGGESELRVLMGNIAQAAQGHSYPARA